VDINEHEACHDAVMKMRTILNSDILDTQAIHVITKQLDIISHHMDEDFCRSTKRGAGVSQYFSAEYRYTADQPEPEAKKQFWKRVRDNWNV